MIGGGGLQADSAPRRAQGEIGLPCVRCGAFHVKQPGCDREVCRGTEPVARFSRRSFLWLGATGAAGLVLASHLPVSLCRTEVLGPFDYGPSIDSILKEVYEPYVAEQLNRPSLMSVLHFSGEEIAKSRYTTGHWAAALAGDDRLIVEARTIDLKVGRNDALR